MNPYVQACEYLKKRELPKAEIILLKLLNEDFDNPVLMFALGMVFLAQRKNGLSFNMLKRSMERIDGAKESYERLGIFPQQATAESRRRFIRQQKAEILNGLGVCYRYEEKMDEARDCFDKALVLSPNDPDIYCNIGTLYINDGQPDSGIYWLEKALAIMPDHSDSRWNMGILQLEKYDFKNGWINYEEGSRARTGLSRIYTYPDGRSLPMWEGERGKKILAFGEQGIGDEIMFSSCLPELIAMSESVVLDCHPRLVTLFERSFGVKCFGTRKQEWLAWANDYHFDARLPMGSLGKFFRNDIKDFHGRPFLKSRVNHEVKNLPGFKVGISWAGGHADTRAHIRSIDFDLLKPILDKDISLVSLQYGNPELVKPYIEGYERKFGKKIHQFDFITDQNSDYDLTAEVVNACDLVISVNTSLVHLCGALGKECWTLTPSRPAWRYGIEGKGMHWYESVTQFRQPKGGSWEVPINEIVQGLDILLRKAA